MKQERSPPKDLKRQVHAPHPPPYPTMSSRHTTYLAVWCRLLLLVLPLPPLQVVAVPGSATQCEGHSAHQHRRCCQAPLQLALGEVVVEVLPPAAAAA